MNLSASIKSAYNRHDCVVQTNGTVKSLAIATKPTGFGSSINGGELLLLALATCFCNDLYREAAKRNLAVKEVNVDVTGEFGADGEPGSNFSYTVQVEADASRADIEALIRHTDQVAEVQNTLRKGIGITLAT
ncbi:OsmC family protein [Larkinella sp. VNQ87]|uniref:OsmC family protein n=1 Tax=Larkinella sp. VNQ87 TaxID=3400921 RepID=UPI003C03CFD9